VPRSKGGSWASRLRKTKGDESTPENLREVRRGLAIILCPHAESKFIQKREQERQKRVEYFRQLAGYELRKENVYVI
jgi:hypothetical protein